VTQKAVTICGQTWTIKRYRRAWHPDKLGECYGPPRREIRVLTTGNRQTDRDTLYHELIHAVEDEHRAGIPHGLVADLAATMEWATR